MQIVRIADLPATLQTIRELVLTPLGTWLLALVVFGFLVVKAPQVPVVQWLIRFKLTRLDWLKEHAANTTDDIFCKEVVGDIRDAMIFERATGIYAERNWRQGLVELHNMTGVSWITIRRARRYMRMELDNKIHIRPLKFIDHLGAWLNATMAWILMGFATFLFISLVVLTFSLAQIMTGILMIALMLSCAYGSAIQNAPKHAVTLIHKRLAELGMR